jgi:hypothetical protein
MSGVTTKKIQIEFDRQGGMRGATVTFSDGYVWQILPKDEAFRNLLLGRLRASAMAADLLKNRPEKINDTQD